MSYGELVRGVLWLTIEVYAQVPYIEGRRIFQFVLRLGLGLAILVSIAIVVPAPLVLVIVRSELCNIVRRGGTPCR